MFYLLAKIDPGVLLIAILATTFSLVGLVSLWAATSQRFWIWRVAVVFALLTPLLLVPAYEPFAILFTQAVTVVTGVALRRHARFVVHRDDQIETKRLRFSVSMLLAITTFVAITAAIVMQLPPYGILV